MCTQVYCNLQANYFTTTKMTVKGATMLLLVLVVVLAEPTSSASLDFLKFLLPSQRSSAELAPDLGANTTDTANNTITTGDGGEPNAENVENLELADELANYNISSYMGSGHTPPGFVIAPENYNKTNEVLLQNDKTLAHMVFNKHGSELVKCTLYDIENYSWRWEKDSRLQPNDFNPVFSDYFTMLDAVRQCSNLARKQVNALLDNRTLSELEENNGSDYRGKNWWKLILAGGNIVNGEKLDGTSVFKGIIPGTKWCGIGDIATDYHDLGPRLDLDICCRAHDHCPIRVKGMTTAYTVSNLSFITRSHCDCDLDFYRCLQQSNSSQATALGYIYFNLPNSPQCIMSQGDKLCDPMLANGDPNNSCEKANKKTGRLTVVNFKYRFHHG